MVLTEDKRDDRPQAPEPMTIAEFLDQYRVDGADGRRIEPVQDGLDHGWGALGLSKTEREPETVRRRSTRFLVSQTPDSMLGDIPLFPLLRCAVYVNGTGAGGPGAALGIDRGLLVESNLWLSSGDTSSTWHEDADANINCLLQGHKHWYSQEVTITVDATRRRLHTPPAPQEPSLGDALRRAERG